MLPSFRIFPASNWPALQLSVASGVVAKTSDSGGGLGSPHLKQFSLEANTTPAHLGHTQSAGRDGCPSSPPPAPAPCCLLACCSSSRAFRFEASHTDSGTTLNCTTASPGPSGWGKASTPPLTTAAPALSSAAASPSAGAAVAAAVAAAAAAVAAARAASSEALSLNSTNTDPRNFLGSSLEAEEWPPPPGPPLAPRRLRTISTGPNLEKAEMMSSTSGSFVACPGPVLASYIDPSPTRGNPSTKSVRASESPSSWFGTGSVRRTASPCGLNASNSCRDGLVRMTWASTSTSSVIFFSRLNVSSTRSPTKPSPFFACSSFKKRSLRRLASPK
mmetsp:Transcript_67096/g.131584  ORF Transcript_67096/g.131584 Transcript_67096/m.131584 type:complete len:332 (-) Transcript_67096:103-1098(-)